MTMGWLGDFGKGFVLGGPIGGAANAFSGGSIWNQTLGNDPGADAERKRKELLYEQAGQSSRFANQGQRGFNELGGMGRENIAGLQRLASGQDSIAMEQLRQGLQQNQAAQMSAAAGAAPQNAAGAARLAAIMMGRQGAALSGQGALAGLQERAQAQGQLSGAIQGLRGQDLNAALQGRQSAIAGYGGYNTPMTPEKSWLEKYGPAIAPAIASGASAISDRRAKKGIRDGESDAAKALAGLKAYSFEYKNEGHGKGRRVGVMAQGLEKAGLGHAVVDTPAGKVVHAGHLATSLAAMMPVISKRLSRLEKRR